MKWRAVCSAFAVGLAMAAMGATSGSGAASGLAPNEMGRVLILMYHGVGYPEGEWQRTPDALASDLRALYERGYRPIALRDFVQGRIDTPAGLSPVVLTFDDGRKNNLELLDRPGGPVADPRSAVGILQGFAAQHPDSSAAATFFLSGPKPFGDRDTAGEKVRYLLDAGMDIGNHTDAHANLALERYATGLAVQRTIGLQQQRLEQWAGAGYVVNTFALCHGARPKNRRLWPFLVSGEYRGHRYRHVAVLNVGGPAALSPFDVDFDPASLPRVRGSDHPTAVRGLYYWLDRFDAEPQTRFVSDGDPDTVMVTAVAAARVVKARIGNRRLVIR